jgi:hypothetical protein
MLQALLPTDSEAPTLGGGDKKEEKEKKEAIMKNHTQ